MAIETIFIGSQPYLVYADVATADEYMAAAFQGDSWRSATTDDKNRSLITATRILDRQVWRGVKFDSNQYNQFPRKEMGIEGLDDSAGVIPDGIVSGSIELALALLNGSTVQDQQSITERVL